MLLYAIILCYAIFRYVMLYYATHCTLCYATLYYVILHYAIIPCYVMLLCATLPSAMLRCKVLHLL